MEKNKFDVYKIESEKSQISFVVDQNLHTHLIYAGVLCNLENYFDLIKSQLSSFPMTELQVTGDNVHHKGAKLSYSGSNSSLIYQKHSISEDDFGKQICIEEYDKVHELKVKTYFRLYNNNACIRTWKYVENLGNTDVGIEWLSSFTYTGILQHICYPDDFANHMELSVAHNSWTAECQWETDKLKAYGLNYYVDGEHKQPSSKRISISNNSSWSCSQYSPNGILYQSRTGQTAAWQIEHNGAWHYELSDTGNGDLLYLSLFGPEEYDNHCWISLNPRCSFETVPVSFVQMYGDKEDALIEMNRYRRNIYRKCEDNQKLPVIFNDYMNCLMGNPSTEIELPLIKAAANAGCEYYVIDCGWYADGYWWDNVGEWLPSKQRFPNGIEQLIQKIKEHGMVPGLWLEIEVMGINCPLAKTLPDDWFFQRHGKRMIDVDRYHLDFRNPQVVDYANKIIDRIVKQYQVGYIKMDYNITTGIGTDLNSDSTGEGMLAHNRAYLSWLDSVFERYPELVIENCGSGGMRHDYAMLSRHSIQSLSDQTDYVRNGSIAAIGASIITPEQCAVWSYPLKKGDEEEVIYNMVNAMLLRIHQSGYLNLLTQQRFNLVKEGISVYKEFRAMIPKSDPVWPMGFISLDDQEACFGLKKDNILLLAVWNNKDQNNTMAIDLSKYGVVQDIKQIYPIEEEYHLRYFFSYKNLNIHFKKAPTARLFSVKFA